MSVYTQQGYKDRDDYLKSLAGDLGLPKSLVFDAAYLLGENEDFDGLVTTLEDYAMMKKLDRFSPLKSEGLA